MIMEYKKQRHPGRLHYCSWMPEPKLRVRKHNKQFSYIIIKKKQKNSVTVSALPVLKILSIPTVEVLRWGQCSAAPIH